MKLVSLNAKPVVMQAAPTLQYVEINILAILEEDERVDTVAKQIKAALDDKSDRDQSALRRA